LIDPHRRVWYFILTESIIDIGKVTIGQLIGLIHQEEISEQGSVRVQSDECLFLLPALKPARKNAQTII